MVKKRVNSMRKGSAFERDICKKLSLWFSHGERDDLFHRTAGSGARSTTRAKKGKNTANSAGDIGYLDVAGKPLIDAITFELKCGYNHVDTTSLIDTLSHNKKPQLLEFVRQAVESARNAQTKYWAVVHRRNGKRVLIHFSLSLWERICEFRYEYVQWTVVPCGENMTQRIISMPLEQFLEKVSPEIFMEKEDS